MSKSGLMAVATIQYSGRIVQIPKSSRPAVRTKWRTNVARPRRTSALPGQHAPGQEVNHDQEDRKEEQRDCGAGAQALRAGDANLIGEHREGHGCAGRATVGEHVDEVDAGGGPDG